MSRLPKLYDDGNMTPEVGIWGERKYNIIRFYCSLFTGSMRDKWDELVYIDLFSGPGIVRLKQSNSLSYGSPLIARDIDIPFDRYIYCEKTKSKLDALQMRIEKFCPDFITHYIDIDVNNAVEAILSCIPQPSKNHKSLALCVSDPYKISDLKFNTIKGLSKYLMDHLVLIPTYMDANRNIETYIKPENTRIENFTGIRDWREKWEKAKSCGENFDIFLTNCFGHVMKKIHYIYEGPSRTVLIRSVPKNLPLYRLALFSRHPLGKKFWKEAEKYSRPQMDLFD